MTNEAINRYISRYQKIARRNNSKYQETGIKRYQKAYDDAMDNIEIACLALTASDDRAERIKACSDLRAVIGWAKQILRTKESPDALIKNLAAMETVYGGKR